MPTALHCYAHTVGNVMRAALLTWDWPEVPSGLGRAAREIALGLVDAGVDLVVLTGDLPLGEVVRQDGFVLRGAAVPRGWHASMRRRAALGHLVAPAAFRSAFIEAERNAPFDVVEATNWYAPGALLPLRVPLVVRASTPAIEGLQTAPGLRTRIDMAAAHKLEAWTARRAAGLISNTEPHAARIRDWYGLAPGRRIDTVDLSLADDVRDAGKAAGRVRTGRPPRLVFVGRAERRKGFDEALGSMMLLPSGDWHLDLVGLSPGDLSARIAALGLPETIRDRVTDHGKIDDRAMHKLFAAACLILAPSRYESYGLVYREAAAFGRPLVACREDPSATAFIDAAGCGVLAADCTARAIAAAILAASGDPGDIERMARAGRAVASHLTRARLAERTLSIYRRSITCRR